MQGSKEVFSQKFSQTAIFRTQAIDFVLEHQIVDLGVPRSSRGGGTTGTPCFIGWARAGGPDLRFFAVFFAILASPRQSHGAFSAPDRFRLFGRVQPSP
jgi:hypothetical protein